MNETYFFLIVEQKDRQPKRIRLQIGYLPLELMPRQRANYRLKNDLFYYEFSSLKVDSRCLL